MSMSVELRETEIRGVLEIETRQFADERGFFTEAYSLPVWRAAGFEEQFVQDNLSLSCKGALRGMHYQLATHGMGKLVRAVAGSIFDVAVDLRKGSPTFGEWVGRTLTAANGLSLWVPVGFAHGFAALEDDSMVLYKCTSTYAPEAERALRYDDPTIAIDWPIVPSCVSEKDAEAPLLEDAEYDFVLSR